MHSPTQQHLFEVQDYDLAATLTSGQAFRWQRHDDWWVSVIDSRWVRLRQVKEGIWAEMAGAQTFCAPAVTRIATGGQNVCTPVEWHWLAEYLQLDVDLSSVLLSFPDDEPMRRAVTTCRGLRLLRQEPWECLASFILSSTKQIVQIQQIVALLCERFGEPVAVPPAHAPAFSFPTADRLAVCAEADLRGCKMGFRAPNLLRTAKMIVHGEVKLDTLHTRTVDEARAELLRFPGVGNKIANCVLLFACSFQQAFPVDVWVMKALRQLYFPKRRASVKRLHRFAVTHFGTNAGYAQQYLFHYMRTAKPRA